MDFQSTAKRFVIDFIQYCIWLCICAQSSIHFYIFVSHVDFAQFFLKKLQVRKLQVEIEAVKQDVGSKRKSAALDHVKTVKRLLGDSKLPAACRDAKACSSTIDGIGNEIEPISVALKASMDALNGSDQERQALDKAYASQIDMAKLLTTLEEQMIPANYEVKVPSEYDDLPQLKKRATVEMVFKKPNNAPFDVNGQNFPEAKMTMVIDGYTGKQAAVSLPLGRFLSTWNDSFVSTYLWLFVALCKLLYYC